MSGQGPVPASAIGAETCSLAIRASSAELALESFDDVLFASDFTSELAKSSFDASDEVAARSDVAIGVRISVDFRFRMNNPAYRSLVPQVMSGPDSVTDGL